MNKLLLLVAMAAVSAGALAACGSTVPTGCQSSAECGDGFSCVDSNCVRATQDAGVDGGTDAGVACATGATRPCGAQPVGACKPGTQTCVNGAWALACVGEVAPTTETCNGVDDDCDGVVDEGVTSNWYPDFDGDGYAWGAATPVPGCTMPSGHVLVTGDCDDTNEAISPAATEVCGTAVDDDCDGAVNEGCGCSTPGSTVTCCGGRGAQTCGNDGVLSACDATVSAETCNGIDDDCNGSVDEGAALCGASGQSCVSGTCMCTGGLTLCNGTCVAVSNEVCDGLDNDCDGAIDETLTVNCYPDADGDRYADSTVTSAQCPVGSRPDFGLCPVGYVGVSASLGDDCNAANAALYRVVASRNDADGDGRCDGAAQNDCVGAGPLAGRRFVSSCEADDCDDANAQAWALEALRNDADNDGYCAGISQLTCASAGWLPAGKKRPGQCNATDDCNDANAQASGFVGLRADADGDGYCVGAGYFDCVNPAAVPSGTRLATSCQSTDDCNDSSAAAYVSIAWASDADNDGYCPPTPPPPGGWCTGSTPPAGYRASASCTAFSDCAPSDATKWRNVSLRTDSDNDGWCVDVAATTCIGTNIPSGKREASACAGSDCRDTNPYANSVCVINEGYTTASHVQTCPSANTPTTYTVNVNTYCPVGFNEVNHRAVRSAGTGQCLYVSPIQVAQQCNFLDGSTCGVVADCVAF